MKRKERFAIVFAALAGLWAAMRKLGWRGRLATGVFGLVALGGIVWALGSLFSQAAVRDPVYYVDKDSIGGTCSTYSEATARNNVTKPFCSLSTADTVVANGGHILVRAGTYTTPFIIDADHNPPVRVRPYPREKPIFQGLYLDGSDGWNFTNFELTGFDGTYCTTPCYEGSGRITLDDSNDIVIAGWNIHDTISGVVTRGSPARRITIAANRIVNVDCMAYSDDCPGGQAGYGIAAGGAFSQVRILNNYIAGTDGDALQMGCQTCEIRGNTFEDIRVSPGNGDHADPYQASSTTRNVQIIGNHIFDANKGVFFTGAGSPVDYKNILIADNLVHHITTVCLEMPPADDVVIRNNTCWDTGLGATYDGSEESTTVSNTSWFIYNNLWGPSNTANQSSNLHSTFTGVVFEGNNIVAENAAGFTFSGSSIVEPTQGQLDGLFTDADAENFTLASGSIAVNAGTGSHTLSRRDLVGKVRQVGTVDIGAYERP